MQKVNDLKKIFDGTDKNNSKEWTNEVDVWKNTVKELEDSITQTKLETIQLETIKKKQKFIPKKKGVTWKDGHDNNGIEQPVNAEQKGLIETRIFKKSAPPNKHAKEYLSSKSPSKNIANI